MQIVTGRRGEPHVTSRQMQAVYRSFLGDFALLDIGEKLRAEAYSDDIVRVYDGVVSVQGIYAVISYNQYDEVYIEPVSVGKKRIDTIVLHYTKNNTLDVEDMQLDVVQGEEYTDNPIAPVVPEGGDAWEGTTDIQVPIYDVEVTNFGLTVIPHARMLTVIPTLDSIAERIPETVVTGVKGDSEVLYRDGDVNITKANIGLGNVDNTSDADKPISTATQTALNGKLGTSLKGANNGLAELDSSGKVPSSQLPSYVDDVVEGYLYNGSFYKDSAHTQLITPMDDKIYVDKIENKSYRWTGNAYTRVDEGVQLGETSSTAYRGDRGKTAYDHSQLTSGNPHNVTKTDVGLGNVPNVATNDQTPTFSQASTRTNIASGEKLSVILGKIMKWFSDLKTVAFSGSYNDLDNKPTIPSVGDGTLKIQKNGTNVATFTANQSGDVTVNIQCVDTVDSSMSDSSTNPLQNKVITKELEGTKTATGNPLTIEDAAPVNAVNLSVDLEPIQDLHGYDHPWVGGAGKNKLPMTVEGLKAANGGASTWNGNSKTIGGVAFTILTDSDGNVTGIRCNGQANGFSFYAFDGSITVPSGSKINLNATKNNGNFDCNAINNGTGIGSISGHSAQTADVTLSDTTVTRVSFYFNSSYNDDITIYPMIRLSTETDSTFAPYSNICPISGRSEVAIQRVGKNLFNIEQWLSTYSVSYVKDNNTYTFNTELSLFNNYYEFNKPINIILSSIKEGGTATNVGFLFYDENDNELTGRILSGTINNAKKFRLDFSLGGSLTLKDPMIRLATVADATFEPYAGKTYTIQLGETVYGGTLDVTRGKMVVDRGYIASYNGETLPSTWISDRDVYASGTNPTTGAQVVYELATPYTIDLTPQQIKMLENTNTLSSDGNMALEYQPNNAIGEAVRAVEESYDPEFAVRPVLKKKAFSGTTDSDGSVTLINASDIPSNHRIIPLQITDMTIGGSAGTYFVEYKPYNSGDSVKGYCYSYYNGSQITPVGSAVTGNFYYYDLEV